MRRCRISWNHICNRCTPFRAFRKILTSEHKLILVPLQIVRPCQCRILPEEQSEESQRISRNRHPQRTLEKVQQPPKKTTLIDAPMISSRSDNISYLLSIDHVQHGSKSIGIILLSPKFPRSIFLIIKTLPQFHTPRWISLHHLPNLLTNFPSKPSSSSNFLT